MKPTLLILAAGIGSRYGSLKQIDKLGPSCERIIDYSVFDAKRAGFAKVVFVIRKDIEKDFNEVFIKKLSKHIEIDYVFQELDNLPLGMVCPKERIKPWGTCHAVIVAASKINEPFAVINADDFYGYEAFDAVSGFLGDIASNKSHDYCMVGYKLKNTLSDYGLVSRGVCETDSHHYLIRITERTQIGKRNDSIFFRDQEGNDISLHEDTIISMNCWGFTPLFFSYAEKMFEEFVVKNIHYPKAEFYIPIVIDDIVKNRKGTVKVLDCNAKWFGVTYQEDKPMVISNLKEYARKGLYPSPIWG
ncbi:MAG TPA: sugar phosphate nucleotidyltransferase [Bacteroidales bacterium]|nr:sugar phosphate nucleotidyltransferase [Bacteroidales bacterium]